MADLLSLIASAITVAGTAFAIARGLATLADALASFGEEVRALSSDIESFAKLVKNVQVVVSSIRRASTVDQGLIRDALDICILVLRPLNNMQRMLNKFKDKYCGNNVQFKRFKAITRWLFRTKRRLLFFWNAVQAQHHLLDTTLELMILKANLGDNVRADIKLIYREALAVAAQKLSGSTASQLLDPGFVAMKTLSSGSEDTSHPRIMIEQACMDSELNLGTNDLSPDGDHERQPSLTTGVFAEELDDLELELLTVLGTEGDEVELEIMEDTRALSRKTLRLANVALRNDNAGTFEDMKERHQRAERATLSSVQPVLSIPQAQPKAQTDIKGDILLQDSIRRKFVIPKIDVQTWQGLCNFMDRCATRPPEVMSYPEEEQFHILDVRGGIVSSFVWEKVIQNDNFDKCYLIYGSLSMLGSDIEKAFQSLQDDEDGRQHAKGLQRMREREQEELRAQEAKQRSELQH